MAVKEKLELLYDLSSINEEQAGKLLAANEEVIKKATSQKKKNVKESKKKSREEKKKEVEEKKKEKEKKKEERKSKVKEIKNKEILEDFPTTEIGAQGGISFFVNQFKSSLPIIAPILVVSAFFIDNLLKLDKLSKKFIDIADARINAFVKRQEQARLDNHLDQIIYTTKAGGSSPRDSYNSFNEYDRVLKQEGTDRNASTIGGVD